MKEIDFKWTTELVKEFGKYFTSVSGSWDKCVESFIASHTPEVKGVDWEILEYRNTAGYHKPTISCEVGGCIIHSVRRISDNVVFSVGDKIDMDDCGAKPIDAFWVGGKGKESGHTENDIWISTNQKKGYGTLLQYASKPLQRIPLFKTEDGKDMFLGDKHYLVDTDLWFVIEDIAANITNPNYWDSRKSFITEEAAKQYIILNKPCLSVSDVLSICDITYEFAKLHTGRLKEIAKSKL